MSEDLSKLQKSADDEVAEDEKVIAKITELEAALAAAKAIPNNQPQIDAITKELNDERAKVDAALNPPSTSAPTV